MSLDLHTIFSHRLESTDSQKTDASNKLAADSQPTNGKAQQLHSQASDSVMVKKQVLPPLTIAGGDPQSPATQAKPGTPASKGNEPGYLSVAKELGEGALDEINNHPGRLLENAAIGIGTGLATVGVVATAPLWVTLGLGGLAVLGTAYELDKHAPSWFKSARIVAKPEAYSQTQITQAQGTLKNLGGGIIDTAFSSLGGINGASFAGGVVKGLTRGLVSAAIAGASSPVEDQATDETAQAVEKSLAKKAGGEPRELQTGEPSLKSSSPEGIVNRMAAGTIHNIKSGQDNGLLKEVTRGVASDSGGDTKVFIRRIDPTDSADLARISQAQLEAKVDSITGQDTGAPLSAMRDDVIKGQLVAVQEDGGDSLGANLKAWAGAAYGDGTADSATPQDVKQLIQAHPALKTSVAEAMLQMLYKGNGDFMELSNLAVRGTENGAKIPLDEPMKIPIIDAKMNWTPGPADAAPVPTWGMASMIEGSMPREVAELYAGKSLDEISPALQKQAEAIQKVFESAAGRAQLQHAGLTEAEITAATARLQYLTTQGFPPLPDIGTEAFDYMLAQNGAMADHYGQVSQSTTLQQIMDAQKLTARQD